MSMGMLAMTLFIGSEVMLFASFFAAYFFIRFNVAEEWPPIANNGERFELPVLLTAVNTAILVASSFTLHWGEHRLKHYNDRKGLERGLLVTILLGFTFLAIQINEYIHLGFTPQDQAFSGAFYTLTGFHGLHVFVGATLLLIMFVRVKRAHDFTPQWATPLQGASLYWHFVDVVWVILFILVYLL
jgi:cytochrome c oxidase subunit 3